MLWSLIDGMDEIVATDWGWKMQDGKLVPVMTDQDIAPDSLTNVIRCKCKVSKLYFYHLKILLSCRIRISCQGTPDIVFAVILYF